MTPPVENLRRLTRQIAADELPYEEALVRLYELRDRYDGVTAAGLIGSAARDHLATKGHRLAFGCCTAESAKHREQLRLDRVEIDAVHAELARGCPE